MNANSTSVTRTMRSRSALALCSAAAVWLFSALPASAAALARVNENVEVTNGVVTLGDLIDNAGGSKAKAVFLAPKIGTTGYISTSRIIEAAREASIAVDSSATPDRVAVTRLGRPIEKSEILGLIRGEIEKHLPAGNDRRLVVEVSGDLPPTFVDANDSAPLAQPRVDWTERSGSYRAEFALPDNGTLTVRGTAMLMTEISVPKAELAEGTVITPDDLETRLVATSSISRNALTSSTDIVGKETRRRVSAGRALNDRDVAPPLLVHRNQLVSIVLEVPGLKIRTEGKALADASAGESVKVMNTQSKRIINGTPVAPGIVSVIPISLTNSGT